MERTLLFIMPPLTQIYNFQTPNNTKSWANVPPKVYRVTYPLQNMDIIKSSWCCPMTAIFSVSKLLRHTVFKVYSPPTHAFSAWPQSGFGAGLIGNWSESLIRIKEMRKSKMHELRTDRARCTILNQGGWRVESRVFRTGLWITSTAN